MKGLLSEEPEKAAAGGKGRAGLGPGDPRPPVPTSCLAGESLCLLLLCLLS